MKCPGGPTTAAQQHEGTTANTTSAVCPQPEHGISKAQFVGFIYFHFLGLKKMAGTVWMPVSVRGILAWAFPMSRMADFTMLLGFLTLSNSQLITFECGFWGMVKAKVTVLKACKKSICPCIVNLAGKAVSLQEWKPSACSESLLAHAACE